MGTPPKGALLWGVWGGIRVGNTLMVRSPLTTLTASCNQRGPCRCHDGDRHDQTTVRRQVSGICAALRPAHPRWHAPPPVQERRGVGGSKKFGGISLPVSGGWKRAGTASRFRPEQGRLSAKRAKAPPKGAAAGASNGGEPRGWPANGGPEARRLPPEGHPRPGDPPRRRSGGSARRS